MVDKTIAALNGGVTVAPTLNDLMLMEQGGNSRPTTVGLIKDLLDGQANRKLVSLGTKGSLNIEMIEATPDLAGTSVTVTGFFPANSIVLAVTAFVNANLTGGLTSFDLGLAGNTGAFATSVGTSASTSRVGVIAPMPIASATNLLITHNGGSGSGNAGKVRVVAYVLKVVAPTS
jgi:hypothetical protein